MTINNPQAAARATFLAQVIEQSRQQRLSLGELVQVAETVAAGGDRAQAGELYKAWIAYNDRHPMVHLAMFNHAVVLRQMGDVAGAISVLRSCLRLNPAFGPAYVNLGRALEDSGLVGEAVELWKNYAEQTAETTADRLSHRLMALEHAGRVLESADRMDEAEAILWQAIELRPDKPESGQHWTAIRQRQCKWPIVTPTHNVSARQLIDSMSPLTLACYSDDPLFQLAKAYRYNKTLVGRCDMSEVTRQPVRQKTGTGQRLRVGYVSSDLRDHAVGFALSEVLELHDKSRVEIFAYYCGDQKIGDATQERMKAVVDCWRDIATLSDIDAARLIAADGVDVLIDVNGYTKMARTRIFGYRPAPVIVNFCGYPGTMASPYHQYMIADPVIVPPENEIYYTEKVLRIACNQPVDRKRKIAERPTRLAAGLPDHAFVFACFNGMQKITQPVFQRWMEILRATPGSLLWLLSGPEDVHQRLRQQALQAGVSPERLIFAPKAANPLHLARIALADLFLDTFPYGAHSTAADAITMGLPVLTAPGKSFASRFCASIVSAAGAPELICDGPEDYVRKAIDFAHNPEKLQAIRRTIADQRETCALRDMPALARRLEDLYWQMQGEAERGELPVPSLRNLDAYYEIGAEIVQAGGEFEPDDAYRALYRQKLAAWDAFSALEPDGRLWN